MSDTRKTSDKTGGRPVNGPEKLTEPDNITVIDSRTKKEYFFPITHGTVKATDLRQIKTSDDDFGLMTYDPAFMNTASCQSRITFIDGAKGIRNNFV